MLTLQCEQTSEGKGCSTIGVCGKTPEVAHLQDAMVHALKSLAVVAQAARGVGVVDGETDRFFLESMFATLTNVNFSADRCGEYLKETIARRDALKAKYEAACKATGKTPASLGAIVAWAPASMDAAGLEAAGVAVGVKERGAALGPDVAGLQELIIYGIKGASACE